MDEPSPYPSPTSGPPPAPPPNRPHPDSGLDFGRCFTFFFEDPDWIKKLLIGSLFTLLAVVLVGSFFVAGYLIRLIRRAARGEARPLPDWDDMGGIFIDGLYAAAVYVVYLLPVVLLSIAFAVGVGVTASPEGEPSPVMALLGVTWFVGLAVALLAIMVFLPAAMIRLAIKGDIASALDVGRSFDFIKRNLPNYLLAILVLILANFISQFGLILLCIGIVPASFWAAAVGAYALGEVALRAAAGDAAS